MKDTKRTDAVPESLRQALGAGPIEAGVLVDIAQIEGLGTEALKATAVRLARTLDEGAGLATAAVARELRAVLETLRQMEPAVDDDDALTKFLTGLRSPVQQSED